MHSKNSVSARSWTARSAGLSILILLLFVGAAPAAQQSPGLAGQRLAEAAERYGSASWPAGPARGGLPVMGLFFDGFDGGPVDFNPGAPVIRRFADGEGVDRFLVEVSVRETTGEARTVLLEYLASVSSPHKVPTLASLGIAAGDIGYVGRAPEKRISWIAFLRGNIAVRVACLDPRADPHPEMGRIAAALDRQILHRSALSPSGEIQRFALAAITPARPAGSAGEVLPLELQLAGEAGAPAAIRWVVGGPGQGYVEQDDSGTWQLHTTKEGTIDLACHVLGPNGFTSTASVTIEVAKE